MMIRHRNILSTSTSDGKSLKLNLDMVVAYERGGSYSETRVYCTGHTFTLDVDIRSFEEEYYEYIDE